MTSDQAAQLIEQQRQLLEVYATMQPLIATVVREIFPPFAVCFAWVVGAVCAWAAT